MARRPPCAVPTSQRSQAPVRTPGGAASFHWLTATRPGTFFMRAAFARFSATDLRPAHTTRPPRVHGLADGASLVVALALAGCAATAPQPAPPLAQLAPAQWVAPLPHGGSTAQLADWWRQPGVDAALADLIEAALADAPTLAAAQARVDAARAQLGSQRAGLMPRLDAAASASRGNNSGIASGGGTQDVGRAPIVTTLQAGLQAQWEIDLFGRQRRLVDAARARVDGADALAQSARVSLVADVAATYHGLRLCQLMLATTTADAASRGETARLARISRDAGFTAPATAALADASAAEGRSRVVQQRAVCDTQRKALVALTGMAEPAIEQKMAVAQVPAAPSALFSIASLPADTLRQRPDVWAAERSLLAARAEIDAADAARWPALSLGGNIAALQLRSGGQHVNLSTWTFGPLQLALPIWDGGRIAANQAAARAAYDEAVANYQGQVRQAVREVETALTDGAAAREREADARAAVAGFRQQFDAVQAMYRQGMASLPDLEEARRTLLNAEIALNQLLHDRDAAGVALYRAAGGGWTPPPDQGGASATRSAPSGAGTAIDPIRTAKAP